MHTTFHSASNHGPCILKRVTTITNESRKVAVLAVIALAAIMLFAVTAVGLVHSTDQTSIKDNEIRVAVIPWAVIDYSMGPAQKFDVNITALKVAYLHGFNVNLTYDATLIECTSVQEGDLLQTGGTTTPLYAINNTSGNVYASVNLTSQEAMVNANGTLLELTFRVRNTGETRLHLYEVNMHNSTGSSLPLVTYDGYFNNKFNIDIAMPLTLFSITLVSLFLNKKTEPMLKSTFEEKEFRVRDAVMLVAMMAIMISLIVFLRGMAAPLMILFLFSYSALLFIFTYLFSKKRWYISAVPSATFVLLYVFLRDSAIWSDYLIGIYGAIFAVLITLYIGSLFTWKTTLVFAVLLTIVDAILVLATGTMIEAYYATASLNLPVVISVPRVPVIATQYRWLPTALGLGDFFFAGLLAIQTSKRYTQKSAIISVVAMSTSYFIVGALLSNYGPAFFPGTLIMIIGWLPLVLWKKLKH